MNEPVVEVQNLTVDYLVGFWRKRPVRVLDNLCMEVHSGEIFGFLGHNGAGKTTTLKALMRIIFPTSGTIRILGRPVDDIEMRSKIGFLPESPYFYDYLTGHELLDYFGKLFGLSAAERGRRIAECLDMVGLSGAANRQLRRYSKGMLQRIGIAQAVLNDPTVVFLDEPMSGLDPIGRREVRDIIQALRDRGKTVFFCTHILSDVEVLCDRVAILRQGKRVAYGRLDEIQGREATALEVVAASMGESTIPQLNPLADSIRRTAAGLHIVLKRETDLEEVIRLIHHNGGRLVSVNPLRTALEDFFIKDDKATAGKAATIHSPA